jgi:branched-chain amino acid transport system permease protein
MRVRAAGADRIGASVSGIDFRVVYLQVFIVGGAIAGLTGMLIAPLASASAFFGFALTIKGFIAGALGGLGSVRGAIVAAMLLGLVESYAGAALGAQWQDVVALGLLIAVLVVRPTGIMPRRVTRTV